MTTFSQLVDTLLIESRRPDMLGTICTYVNQTIRDVHFNRNNNSLIKFRDNMVEHQLFADIDERYVWAIEFPHLFAHVESVYFPEVDDYARERSPSSMFAFQDGINTRHIWYRTGPNLAFNGYGGKGAAIWLAFFEYPSRLTYFASLLRPATWNAEDEAFQISQDYNTNPESRARALRLTTNWLLQRWEDVILEGARAKLYKRLADDVRMRAAYSSFESARVALVAAETYESTPIYHN